MDKRILLLVVACFLAYASAKSVSRRNANPCGGTCPVSCAPACSESCCTALPPPPPCSTPSCLTESVMLPVMGQPSQRLQTTPIESDPCNPICTHHCMKICPMHCCLPPSPPLQCPVPCYAPTCPLACPKTQPGPSLCTCSPKPCTCVN